MLRLGIIDYIDSKLKSGIETLQYIMKEKDSRPYLTNVNFGKIFDHCLMHFWANKTPEELLVEIVKKIHSKFSSKKPVCIQNATKFLNDNMICSSKFVTDLVSWLF
jgi:acyl carrier protein phosphodiesterase